MSQAGPKPINHYLLIAVTEYFIKDKGLDIPAEWLEYDPESKTKILRLKTFPEREKTKYHDIFYKKYFEKYPEEEFQ